MEKLSMVYFGVIGGEGRVEETNVAIEKTEV